MECGVYSVEEVVKLMQTKIEDIVVLFGYLPDDVKQEVWKYWQVVTNKLHNVVQKINRPKNIIIKEKIRTVPELENRQCRLPSDLENIKTNSEFLSNVETLKQLAEIATCGQSNIGEPHTIQPTEHDIHLADTTQLPPPGQNYNFNVLRDAACIGDGKDKFIPEIPEFHEVTARIPDAVTQNESCSRRTTQIHLQQQTTSLDKAEVVNDVAEEDIKTTSDETISIEKNTNTDEAEVEDSNRKYPKRKRKSAKKNSIYSYDDNHEEAGVEKKSNKENCKSKPAKRSDGSVTCDVCGMRLARTSMIAHRRQHTGSRPFKCSMCGHSFTTKANMVRHENTHNGIKPYKCSECSKSFGENKTLKIHMLTHSGEKPFSCTICGESFAQKGTLQHHVYRHTGHKGHLCHHCGKPFRQKSQLRAHQRRHENIRSFACDVCQKSFHTKSDLIRHQRKHTNIKPFTCTICSKSYTRRQYLKEHENIHKGVKPHQCSHCDKTFHESSALYRHLKSHKPKPIKEFITPETLVIGQEFEIPVVSNLSDAQVSAVLDASNQYGEVYHIAYLEQPVTDNVGDMIQIQQSGGSYEEADFSAINLLANATTQLNTIKISQIN